LENAFAKIQIPLGENGFFEMQITFRKIYIEKQFWPKYRLIKFAFVNHFY